MEDFKKSSSRIALFVTSLLLTGFGCAEIKTTKSCITENDNRIVL